MMWIESDLDYWQWRSGNKNFATSYTPLTIRFSYREEE